MKIAFVNTGLAETAITAAINLAAFILLGVVAAHWAWQWLAPMPEARLVPQADSAGLGSSAGNLFGSASVEKVAVAPTGLSIRLLGVVAAAEGRAAYAVMVLDGKEIVAVAKGGEVGPGVVLSEVAPDHVILDREGAREMLSWPDRSRPTEGGNPKGTR